MKGRRGEREWKRRGNVQYFFSSRTLIRAVVDENNMHNTHTQSQAVISFSYVFIGGKVQNEAKMRTMKWLLFTSHLLTRLIPSSLHFFFFVPPIFSSSSLQQTQRHNKTKVACVLAVVPSVRLAPSPPPLPPFPPPLLLGPSSYPAWGSQEKEKWAESSSSSPPIPSSFQFTFPSLRDSVVTSVTQSFVPFPSSF